METVVNQKLPILIDVKLFKNIYREQKLINLVYIGIKKKTFYIITDSIVSIDNNNINEYYKNCFITKIRYKFIIFYFYNNI